MAFWFRSGGERDREIANRFAATLEAAASGALDAWEAQPRSCLALIVVLDQFPRNIHRGTPRAFDNDAQALRTTCSGIARGHLAALATIEQAFFLMPYQHAEDVDAQREGLPLFERMAEQARPEWRDLAQGVVRYARLHLEIIERFGRFPHRNAILGRESTPEELDYLSSSPESFGQSV